MIVFVEEVGHNYSLLKFFYVPQFNKESSHNQKFLSKIENYSTNRKLVQNLKISQKISKIENYSEIELFFNSEKFLHKLQIENWFKIQKLFHK